ncbi:DUF2614 family zinc ribbon-containing protein [Paenibacillus lactis]|uniref:DUF2614 family zinc ribbon-containing protein n=1 Tax=Paenibacillus lactis TaxID=228574 RepID=UPI000A065CCF
MIVLLLFVIIGVPIALLIIVKAIQSGIALSRPPIECPVCGRQINVVGKTPTCYKCRSSLILHANGQYIKK